MSFQLLTKDSLTRIRPLLETKFPKTAMMLNIFDMVLCGKYDDTRYRWNIFGYNGVPSLESLFIDVHFTTTDDIDKFSILYAPEVVTEEMINAFEKLHDWKTEKEFGAVPVEFVTHLEDIAKRNGGSLLRVNPCDDIYLSVDDALQLDLEREHLKGEFEVDDLLPNHAAIVNSHWKYGKPEMESLIAELLRVFPAAGVYTKPRCMTDPDRDENPVSFVMFNVLGTFNALHTLQEYRSRGLGRWTMEAASKRLAMQGIIPLCEIEPYNVQSMRIMEQIGFKLAQKVCWVMYAPNSKEPTTS